MTDDDLKPCPGCLRRGLSPAPAEPPWGYCGLCQALGEAALLADIRREQVRP